jgi:type IX secretion system PorP/SprF family membrane protein
MKSIHTTFFRLAFIFLCSSGPAIAQDYQLTQFYASPLALNPGFAGASGGNRVTLHNRVQWAGLPKPFRVHVASFDHSLPQYNSGLGAMVTSEVNGTSRFKTQTANLIYSYRIDLNKRWTVRPGLQMGIGSRSIDYSQLVFGDQIYERGLVGTQEDFSGMNRTNFFDVGTGAVLHNDKVWIGITAHHLNRPNVSFVHNMEALLIKTSIHGGAKINLDNNKIKSAYKTSPENIIIPSFLYKQQGRFKQLDLGVYWNHEPLIIGAWYRGVPVFKSQEGYPFRDAVAILLGTKWKSYYMGYSYDITLSRMDVTNSGGSHEISLSYVFPNKPKKVVKKRRDMVLPCPDF